MTDPITMDDVEKNPTRYRLETDGKFRMATEEEILENVQETANRDMLRELEDILQADWPAWAVTADQAGWTVVPPGKPGDPWRVLEGESPK